MGKSKTTACWRTVNNRRNSETGCGTPLDALDWSYWWMDTSFRDGRGFYLHVRHRNGETWHRVYCRAFEGDETLTVRLAMEDGQLRWILSPRVTS